MNIRDAILKAADHIERNPSEFWFFENTVPKGPGCGTPGCAAGWVAHFYGSEARCVEPFLVGVMGVRLSDFLRRMDCDFGFYEWHRNPSACATVLRLYADKYHPATERPMRYPDWQAMAAVPSVPENAADESLRWTA